MPETVHTLKSAHLGNERSVWIRQPNQNVATPNLLVFLDGEIYRERIQAPTILDGLSANETVTTSWVVYVSMQSPEARWKECPCYPPFAAFMKDELIPALENWVPALQHVASRTLIGVSYTGLAAAYVAFACPGLFQKVISQSGSFWSDSSWLTRQFRTLSVPLPTAFYLSVGSRETQKKVRHREGVVQDISQVQAIRDARDALRATGHSVEYQEPEGYHEFNAWAKALPDALVWASSKSS